jgi:integrase
MKASKEHRVPLSKFALHILNDVPREKNNPFVFIGLYKAGLSNMAMAATLRRMDRNDITVHGFRSTFRTWAGERTAHPVHVIEQALAHSIGTKVERSYARGDLLEKRRRLMLDWGKYCVAKPMEGAAKVVSLRNARQ